MSKPTSPCSNCGSKIYSTPDGWACTSCNWEMYEPSFPVREKQEKGKVKK